MNEGVFVQIGSEASHLPAHDHQAKKQQEQTGDQGPRHDLQRVLGGGSFHSHKC